MEGDKTGNDVLSVRQVKVLLSVALLAPATDLLPTVAAQQVGKGGWLTGLGMLPVLLLALWVGSRTFCGQDICKTVGRPVGYTIIIIYLLWILFVIASVLRLSAARMEAVYGRLPSVWLSAGLAVIAAWVGMGKASALARAAEIFYLALAVVLAGVLLLGLFRVKWQNLYPVEWTRLPEGSFRSAGILLNVMPVAVLGKRIPQKARSKQKARGWMAVFCAVITVVLAVVLGCLGSGLSARLETPYFITVQGLGIKGAFQRTEALVAAVWMLSDLILCAALLRAAKEYAARMASEQWGRRSVPVLAGVALAGGWLLFPDEGVRSFCIGVLPVIGMVLGICFPAFLWMLSRGRAKNRR